MPNSSVQTDLIANDKVTAVVNKAAANLQQYASQARTSLDAVAGKFAMLGSAATAALGYVTGASAGKMLESAKLADALGTSIGQLQQIMVASKKGPDELAMPLERLNVLFGEAKQGSQEAQDAFAAVGVSLEQIRGDSARQNIERVIQGLGKIEDPAMRAANAAKIFGERGVRGLEKMLGGGPDALANAAKKIEAMGIGYKDEDVEKVRAAKAAITEMQASLEQLGQQIAVAVSPAVQKIVGAFSAVANAVSKISSSMGDGASKFLLYAGAIGGAAIALGKVIGLLRETAKALAITQALSGPVGWATLAAGIAAAAGISVAMDYATSAPASGSTGAKGKTSQTKSVQSQLATAEENLASRRRVEAMYTEKGNKTPQWLLQEIAAKERTVSDLRRRAAASDASMVVQKLVDENKNKHVDLTKLEQIQKSLLTNDPTMKAAWAKRPEDLARVTRGLSVNLYGDDRTAGQQYQRALQDLNQAHTTTLGGKPVINDVQYKRSLEELAKAFGQVLTPMEQFSKQMDELREKFDAGIVGQKQFDRASLEMEAKGKGDQLWTGRMPKYLLALRDMEEQVGYGTDEYGARKGQLQRQTFGVQDPLAEFQIAITQIRENLLEGSEYFKTASRNATEAMQRGVQDMAKANAGLTGPNSDLMTRKEKLDASLAAIQDAYKNQGYGEVGSARAQELMRRAQFGAIEQYGMQPHPFQSSIEGIQDTWKRIQVSHASDGGDTPEQKALQFTEANTKAVESLGVSAKDFFQWAQRFMEANSREPRYAAYAG
jgi:hypothetical protein